MRILLTGFEPFGGSSVNPSREAVLDLAAGWAAGGATEVELHALILPVVGGVAPRRVCEAIDRLRPHAVASVGESSRASAITFERLFINVRDYRAPDNAGRTARERPIVPGGPLVLESSLPIDAMRRAVRKAGVAEAASYHAGTFLCNEVAYATQAHLRASRSRGRIPAGFIHVPRLPAQLAGSPAGEAAALSMPLEDIVRGLDAALRALIRSLRGAHTP